MFDRLKKLFYLDRGYFFMTEDFYGPDPEFPENSHQSFEELDSAHFIMQPIFQVKGRRERYQKWQEEGHRCFGFVNETGEVASYLWLACPESSATFVPFSQKLQMIIKPGEAYLFDCRTAPAFQKQGFYKNGLCEAIKICARRGARVVYIQCKRDNLASRKGILSAGFHDAFSYCFIHVGSWHWIRYSIRKRIHFIGGEVYDVIGMAMCDKNHSTIPLL
jgi:RimJ/RimL family protein N-acetyltransferase